MVTIGTSVTTPNPPPPFFIFLLAPEEVLSFKLKYCANLFKLINFLDWEILHHRTQRFVAVDLLIFHILEGCPQVRKKLISLVP